MDEKDFFLVLDFDGTITNKDVNDLVLAKFARPEWFQIEESWRKGQISSQQCLKEEVALVAAGLPEILIYVDSIAVDAAFPTLAKWLQANGQPLAIISDGFQVFIERILANTGIRDMAVYANGLSTEDGRLKASFMNAATNCPAGTCKCALAQTLSKGLPVVLVGDGQSDYCLAKKADYVFAKGKLADYCRENKLPYIGFSNMTELHVKLAAFRLFFGLRRDFRGSLKWNEIFEQEGC